MGRVVSFQVQPDAGLTGEHGRHAAAGADVQNYILDYSSYQKYMRTSPYLLKTGGCPSFFMSRASPQQLEAPLLFDQLNISAGGNIAR